MPRRKKGAEEPVEVFATKPDMCAHSIFAASLAYLLGGFNPIGITIAVAFALIPDLDIFAWHRALLHNLFAATIIPCIVASVTSPALLKWMFIGYFSHVLLDLFSPTGVALLWPFVKYYFPFPFFHFVKSGFPALIFSVVVAVLIFMFKGPFPILSFIH
jgi:membrane-bound metal-dependent hydrolase YbcI (DUF457 family)